MAFFKIIEDDTFIDHKKNQVFLITYVLKMHPENLMYAIAKSNSFRYVFDDKSIDDAYINDEISLIHYAPIFQPYDYTLFLKSRKIKKRLK